jgi:homoserine dehydrogenase
MGEKTINLVLTGFGNVGRAFFMLLQEKAGSIQKKYDLDLHLRAIFEVGGGLFSSSSISQQDVTGKSASELARSPLWKPALALETVLKEIEAGVLVECTPSDIKTGGPGLRHIRTALDDGWHVAAANKGPLVVALKDLRKQAERKHVELKFSGATAAALPTLDVGLISLAGAEILAVEGILNGTSNFILGRMEQGAEYSEALKEAQSKGIAERNPRLDVEGWDTAVKLLLIANTVMGLELSLDNIKVQGIANVAPSLIEAARKEGKALKLLGTVRRDDGSISAEVSVSAIDRSHPLFGVAGTNKGVVYFTDSMGAIAVTGGKSDPRGAAAALLKDIINIYR